MKRFETISKLPLFCLFAHGVWGIVHRLGGLLAHISDPVQFRLGPAATDGKIHGSVFANDHIRKGKRCP